MKDLEKKIEEAAIEYSKTSFVRDDIQRSKRFAFIDAVNSPEAKEYWQKGMYTEEEAKKFMLTAFNQINYADLMIWFEQNKKQIKL